MAELEYTENWDVEETKDLERMKKSYDLFMQTLESIQDQPNYPLVSEIGDKEVYNDSYYEMVLGILPHSCISKSYVLYEMHLQVPIETIHQINRYENLQKQICGSLDENNQPLETAISYRNKIKKRVLEKRVNLSSFDERYQKNFNKLDNKELVEFFRSLLSFALNPTDNNTDTNQNRNMRRRFLSENEQAEFCISIRSPQRPCFCTTGIVCTENYCIDRPNCVEPEDADYKHLLNDYTPSEKSAKNRRRKNRRNRRQMNRLRTNR